MITIIGFFWGDFHPALVHFPIVLFIVAFVLDICVWRGKTKFYPLNHWFVIIAALCAIPTAITGWIASEEMLDNPYVPIHKALALSTLTYGTLHAIFRAYAVISLQVFTSGLFALISLFNVLLVGVTADYGGAISHGEPLLMWEIEN